MWADGWIPGSNCAECPRARHQDPAAALTPRLVSEEDGHRQISLLTKFTLIRLKTETIKLLLVNLGSLDLKNVSEHPCCRGNNPFIMIIIQYSHIMFY